MLLGKDCTSQLKIPKNSPRATFQQLLVKINIENLKSSAEKRFGPLKLKLKSENFRKKEKGLVLLLILKMNKTGKRKHVRRSRHM